MDPRFYYQVESFTPNMAIIHVAKIVHLYLFVMYTYMWIINSLIDLGWSHL